MKHFVKEHRWGTALVVMGAALAVALLLGNPMPLLAGAVVGSILDLQNEFSDSQAVTATAISTNVIDLGDDVTLRNIGGSPGVYLVVQTDVAATDSGSDATLALSLESDSTADLATSPTVHWSSGAKAFAAFSPAGTTLAVVPLPYGDYERYLGVRYTVASGPLTAGKFSAFLTRDPQFWTAWQANNPTSHN